MEVGSMERCELSEKEARIRLFLYVPHAKDVIEGLVHCNLSFSGQSFEGTLTSEIAVTISKKVNTIAPSFCFCLTL